MERRTEPAKYHRTPNRATGGDSMSLIDALFCRDGGPRPAEVRLDGHPDDALKLLGNERRRLTLREVARRDDGDGLELGEIATDVAAKQLNQPPTKVNNTERKRVYVALYQTHLHKLDEAGYLRYDDEHGTIYATERTHRAVRAMEIIDEMIVEPREARQ